MDADRTIKRVLTRPTVSNDHNNLAMKCVWQAKKKDKYCFKTIYRRGLTVELIRIVK
jgi:hypothetical protein